MVPSQRESPLKPQQDEKQASQEWVADVIHQRNFWHRIVDEISKNVSGGAQYNVNARVKAMRRRIALQSTSCEILPNASFDFREALGVRTRLRVAFLCAPSTC